MMTKPLKNIEYNQGISLVIALLFLFISTLIGITALRTSILNEKMSLNSLQREQALEAAEAALIAGEAFVEMMPQQIIDAVVTTDLTAQSRTVTSDAQTCTALNGGVCAPKDVFAPNSQFENWVDITGEADSLNVWSTNGRHFVLLNDTIITEYDLNTAPRYIIEFLGYIRRTDSDPDENIESQCITDTSTSIAWQVTDWPYCSLDPAQFRITALATAGNLDETRVMLQTTYVVN